MSNDDVYAAGLLNRALDPATQPLEIKNFLAAEFDFLDRFIFDGAGVIDIGCGTGRHLVYLGSRLRYGLGVDYDPGTIAAAIRRDNPPQLEFIIGDATAVPTRSRFDRAICMTNSWGTMSDKGGVVREMRRLAPAVGSRLLSVYSHESIGPRLAWYRNLGHEVSEETETHLVSEGGFQSEHFTPDRLRRLIGECELHPLAGIAWAVVF